MELKYWIERKNNINEDCINYIKYNVIANNIIYFKEFEFLDLNFEDLKDSNNVYYIPSDLLDQQDTIDIINNYIFKNKDIFNNKVLFDSFLDPRDTCFNNGSYDVKDFYKFDKLLKKLSVDFVNKIKFNESVNNIYYYYCNNILLNNQDFFKDPECVILEELFKILLEDIETGGNPLGDSLNMMDQILIKNFIINRYLLSYPINFLNLWGVEKFNKVVILLNDYFNKIVLDLK
jgi:hypothetical protein